MFSDDFRKAKSGMVLAIKTVEELQRQLRLTTITNVINVAPKCAALRPSPSADKKLQKSTTYKQKAESKPHRPICTSPSCELKVATGMLPLLLLLLLLDCCSCHMRVHECVPSRTISFTYLHKFLGQTPPSTSKSTPCYVELLFGFLVAAVCFAVVLARTCSLLWLPTHCSHTLTHTPRHTKSHTRLSPFVLLKF